MNKLGKKTLEIAITQIGVEEIPRNSNAGPAVEKYLKSVGLGKGYAWCMAFVYWCAKEASKELGIENPLFKTAGVLAMYNKEKGSVVVDPQPGDIFVMDYGKGLGHTGLVERVEKDIIHTIEGNTNIDGSREGYGVFRRKRTIKSIKAFVRL